MNSVSRNDGTAKATNVELIARLPSGLRFTSANNQGSYRAATHSVHWSLAELERDVDAVVELKTVPVDVGNQPIKFESFADLNVRSTAEQPLKVEHLVDVFFDIDDVVDPIEIGKQYQLSNSSREPGNQNGVECPVASHLPKRASADVGRRIFATQSFRTKHFV